MIQNRTVYGTQTNTFKSFLSSFSDSVTLYDSHTHTHTHSHNSVSSRSFVGQYQIWHFIPTYDAYVPLTTLLSVLLLSLSLFLIPNVARSLSVLCPPRLCTSDDLSYQTMAAINYSWNKMFLNYQLVRGGSDPHIQKVKSMNVNFVLLLFTFSYQHQHLLNSLLL